MRGEPTTYLRFFQLRSRFNGASTCGGNKAKVDSDIQGKTKPGYDRLDVYSPFMMRELIVDTITASGPDPNSRPPFYIVLNEMKYEYIA